MNDRAEPLSGPHFQVSVVGDVYGEDTEENREIVRRIHACVNACEGISTEELEKGILQDMQRVIAQAVPLLAEKKDSLEQRIQQHAAEQSTTQSVSMETA